MTVNTILETTATPYSGEGTASAPGTEGLLRETGTAIRPDTDVVALNRDPVVCPKTRDVVGWTDGFAPRPHTTVTDDGPAENISGGDAGGGQFDEFTPGAPSRTPG